MSFANKMVVIVNKSADIGVALNAVAHASLALGATLGSATVSLQEYKDASGNNWPISEMPYIVLRGKSGEIRKAILTAKEEGITQIAFVETMTGGTSAEQIERTAKVSEEEHIYLAGVLFGEWDKVNEITKKLSLYR